MPANMTASSLGPMIREMWEEGTIKEESFRDHPFWAMVDKEESWVGDLINVPIKYANPQNRSASISTALAGTSSTKLAAFIVGSAKDFSTYEIDDETVLACENEGAVYDAVELETGGAFDQLVASLAHALWNDGTGKVGQVSADASSIITLTDAEDVLQFEPGMTLKASATLTGGATRAGSIVVGNVDPDLPGFSYTGSITGLVANDYLYADGDYDAKLAGVASWIPASIANSGDSFKSVNRAAHKERLGGVRFNGANMSISEALTRGLYRVGRTGGGGRFRPEHVFMNSNWYTNLQIELGNQVQYIEWEHEEVNIGFRGIQVYGRSGQKAAAYADDDCPNNYAFPLSLNTWKLKSRRPAPHLVDTDGLKALRSASADSTTGRFRYYAALICTRPGANGRISLPAQ